MSRTSLSNFITIDPAVCSESILGQEIEPSILWYEASCTSEQVSKIFGHCQNHQNSILNRLYQSQKSRYRNNSFIIKHYIHVVYELSFYPTAWPSSLFLAFFPHVYGTLFYETDVINCTCAPMFCRKLTINNFCSQEAKYFVGPDVGKHTEKK